MSAIRKKTITSVAPAHVMEQISRGDLIDQDDLLAWWTASCPEWLRAAGVAPDLAALLSPLPAPARWSHVAIVGGPGRVR